MSGSEVFEDQLAQLREDVNGLIVETADDVRQELNRRINSLENDLDAVRNDVRDLERRMDRVS